MRSLLAILFVSTLLLPGTSAAQSGSAVSPATGDTAAPAPKKKGGMFGKMKGLAKNKIVKTVAKTALCTVVPGGQVVAGALDAAETKNVAGAAASAAGGGSSCMPGMAGMAPSGPGAGGIGAAGVGALGASVSGAGLPGQPSAGMPAMAISPEQLKQMQEQYAKMGMDTAQLRAMQQMMAGAPGAAAAGATAAPGSEPASGGPALSLEKGRMVVRQLPWVAGSDALQPGGEPIFGSAMRELAAAIQATTKHYKIEAKVEDQGGKAPSRLLAQKRAAAVVAGLTARGVPAERLVVSGGGSDKDPRIVVSEGK
jgi:hypothetical protein